MHTEVIPEEIKQMYISVFENIRKDRDRYFNWIKDEIEQLIKMINEYDKIYVLGGLAKKLVQATPTVYNKFLENYQGNDKDKISESEFLQADDEIELLLEYAMSISVATLNSNAGKIPSADAIKAINVNSKSIFTNFG